MESDFWQRLREVTPRMTTDAERSKFLQKVTGVRQASVSRWKTGPTMPSPKHMKEICKATGAAFAYLYEKKGPRVSEPEPGSQGADLLTEFYALSERRQQDAMAYVRFLRAQEPAPE